MNEEFIFPDATDTAPSLTTTDVAFDLYDPQDVEIEFDLGNGTLAASTITSVALADGTALAFDADEDDGSLTIAAAALEDLDVGDYIIIVTFDDDDATEGEVALSVTDSTPPLDTAPSLTTTDVAFDLYDPQDVEIEFDLGNGTLAASTITSVALADGTALAFDADEDDGSLTIAAAALEDLDVGDYIIIVTFDDDDATEGEVALSVTDSTPPLDTAPSLITKNVTFVAVQTSAPEDVVITFDLGLGALAATGIISVALDDGTTQTPLDTADYSVSLIANTLTIDGGALNVILTALGDHTIIITFDDDAATEDTATLTVEGSLTGYTLYVRDEADSSVSGLKKREIGIECPPNEKLYIYTVYKVEGKVVGMFSYLYVYEGEFYIQYPDNTEEILVYISHGIPEALGGSDDLLALVTKP